MMVLTRWFGKAQDAVTKVLFGAELPVSATNFHDLKDKDINGNEITMKSFEGSILCVVNVACKCGLTSSNYSGLSKLIDVYGHRGFKVLVFPCNQFLGQEPGESNEIVSFVAEKFDAHEKFIFFEKGNVNGKDTREIFSFLKQKLPSQDGSTDIRWNFTKFLVDHEGNPYKRYGPTETPSVMKEDIEVLLQKKEESEKKSKDSSIR